LVFLPKRNPLTFQGVSFLSKAVGAKKLTPAERRAYRELARAARKLLAAQRNALRNRQRKERIHAR
jgi:hypothetical protein